MHRVGSPIFSQAHSYVSLFCGAWTDLIARKKIEKNNRNKLMRNKTTILVKFSSIFQLLTSHFPRTLIKAKVTSELLEVYFFYMFSVEQCSWFCARALCQLFHSASAPPLFFVFRQSKICSFDFETFF